jgi:hypothetical protein
MPPYHRFCAFLLSFVSKCTNTSCTMARIYLLARTARAWCSGPKVSTGIKVEPIIENRLGLLSVCSQIYAETLLLPFNLNTFSLRPLVAQNFLPPFSLPSQWYAITTLRLPIIANNRPLPSELYQRLCMCYHPLSDGSLAFRNKLRGLKGSSSQSALLTCPYRVRLHHVPTWTVTSRRLAMVGEWLRRVRRHYHER